MTLSYLAQHLNQELTPLEIFSRCMISITWGWAISQLWKHRNLPQVNPAIATAMSIILAQGLVILGVVPANIMVFFLALSNISLVNSFVRMVLAFSRALRNDDYTPVVARSPSGRKALIATCVGIVVTFFITFLIYV